MASQLKMYWLTDNPLKDYVLPEGYSFSHYSPENKERDIHDWNECIRTWDHSDETDEERFKHEIFDFKDINPVEDTWFLDYNGEHIGTATSFIYKSTGMGDMHWVGIKKEFRGKDLSKYLSWIVMKTLKERGAPYVSLTTGEGRPAAVKSYLNAGFLPVEYAEGMEERWLAVMDKFGIDELQLLNEDAAPLKMLYRKK